MLHAGVIVVQLVLSLFDFFFPSELKENEFWSLLHHSCISFVIGIEFIFIMRKTLEMRGVFCVRNAGSPVCETILYEVGVD